jgi:isoleucyl-tRNA synthetase
VNPTSTTSSCATASRALIVAAALRDALAQKVGRELPVERSAARRGAGRRPYAPPFDWFRAPTCGTLARGAADFVELDAGTGIVHIAPAFGESDFELLRREQQRDPSLPLLCAVRPDGSFDPEIAEPAYAGRWVKDADRDLTRALRERGLLWHAEQIRHDYPFCVRSDSDPLIQYARPAWYIRTTAHVKDALDEQRADPLAARAHPRGPLRRLPAQQRRLGALARALLGHAAQHLGERRDRAHGGARVGRGDPRAQPGGVRGFERARERDPQISPHLVVHKPWIDGVTWTRPGEPGTYRRVPEVIDAWFDSGSMPFAQWGYPQRGRAEFEASFPPTSSPRRSTRRAAGSTRCSGSRRCSSRSARSRHPYKTCIVLGHVADRYGKKESKSKGNYTPPEVILDRVRLEFAAVAPERASSRGHRRDRARGLRGPRPHRRVREGAHLPRRPPRARARGALRPRRCRGA